ncbi:MAG: hypothetical protein WDZ64_01960 [Parcubacteria group bacterium]
MLEQARRNAISIFTLALVFVLGWGLTGDVATASVSILLMTGVVGAVGVSSVNLHALSLTLLSIHFLTLTMVILAQQGFVNEALVTLSLTLGLSMEIVRRQRQEEKKIGMHTPVWQLILVSLPVVGALVFLIWRGRDLWNDFVDRTASEIL